jgi:N,N-dimethylformamidase beta subunit-like, C-terminal
MLRRPVLGLVVVAVAVVLAVAVDEPRVSPGLLGPTHPAARPSDRSVLPAPVRHRRPKGTGAWRLTRPATDGQIEGYATRISVAPGDRVGLRVSTTASRFRVRAYRFGWYRGGQAHLVWRSRWLAGHHRRPASFARRTTRTVTASWRNSLTVPTDGWPAGAYVLKLVASSGKQAYAPLFVRSRSVAGRVVLVAPVATWQAYNDWGGYSLYTSPPGDHRAYAVSFDRPFDGTGRNVGVGDMLYGVRPVVERAERAGVPLAYLTDLDLAHGPRVLAGARAYVSMGHDEYWTSSMRRTVLDARRHGTNLVFLGADTEFWRVRLAASPVGRARVVVGYRWAYQQDPLRADRERTTAPFAAAPHPQPPEQLTGTRYECYPVDASYRVTSPHWWGFHGTRVHAGSRFARLVGIEADRVYPGARTPRPLQVLSSSPYRCKGVPTSAQSVYYTTSSGAGVFTAGTLRWTCALYRTCGAYPVSERTQRFTRRVTANLLHAFAQGPAGRRHPAHDNLAKYHFSRVRTVPAE